MQALVSSLEHRRGSQRTTRALAEGDDASGVDMELGGKRLQPDDAGVDIFQGGRVGVLRRQAVVGREDLGRGLLGEVRNDVEGDGNTACNQTPAKGVDNGPVRRGLVLALLLMLHGERHEARDVEFGAVSGCSCAHGCGHASREGQRVGCCLGRGVGRVSDGVQAGGWRTRRWRLAAQKAPVVGVDKRWTTHCKERY